MRASFNILEREHEVKIASTKKSFTGMLSAYWCVVFVRIPPVN